MIAVPQPITSIHTHRVSYGETDCMGVLYYAEYLHIFERSRGQLIRELGMSYAQVEAKGIFLPVREASCRYRAPARYDELLETHVTIQTVGKASITFQYAIFKQDSQNLLANGSTQHAFVNASGRPVPIPTWFQTLLGL